MSGEQRVFALGDVAVEVHPQEPQQRPAYASDASSSSLSPSHTRLPATAQVAFQQADYAAWNLWATINGRPLLPFRWGLTGARRSRNGSGPLCSSHCFQAFRALMLGQWCWGDLLACCLARYAAACCAGHRLLPCAYVSTHQQLGSVMALGRALICRHSWLVQ